MGTGGTVTCPAFHVDTIFLKGCTFAVSCDASLEMECGILKITHWRKVPLLDINWGSEFWKWYMAGEVFLQVLATSNRNGTD